jgi:hypothetical protein
MEKLMNRAHDPWIGGRLWSTVVFGRGRVVGSLENGLADVLMP